jgi:hypothetical protein
VTRSHAAAARSAAAAWPGPAPGHLAEIEAACARLPGLIMPLEARIPRPASRPPAIRAHPAGGGSSSRPPWSPHHFDALEGIIQAACEEDSLLRLRSGLTPPPGPWTSRRAQRVLPRIPSLAALPCVPPQDTARTAAALGRALRRARIALGDEGPGSGSEGEGEGEAWQRLPQRPGEPPDACPWCRARTLRWQPASQVICCVSPRCAAADGRPPRGSLVPAPPRREEARGEGAAAWRWELRWRDGSEGLEPRSGRA